MEELFWANIAGGNTRTTGHARSAVVTFTLRIGMRRVIQTRISPNSCGLAHAELDWRKDYADWPALRKMEYIDELMRSLAGKQPVHTPQYRAPITIVST